MHNICQTERERETESGRQTNVNSDMRANLGICGRTLKTICKPNKLLAVNFVLVSRLELNAGTSVICLAAWLQAKFR